jgi:hypothetical protein
MNNSKDEELDFNNFSILESKKCQLQKNLNDTNAELKNFKKEKEKLLELFQKHLDETESELQNQSITFSDQIEILEKKEAQNLEEILLISRQVENIFLSTKEKPKKLISIQTNEFEKYLKSKIHFTTKKPKITNQDEVYLKIDLIRKLEDKQKVLDLCLNFKEFEDLCIMVWTAEVLQVLGKEGHEELLEKIISSSDIGDNDGFELFAIGKAYELKNDLIHSLEFYEKSASLGNAYGLVNFGYAFSKGIGKIQNHNEAFKYYKMSADLGYFRGQHNIGYFYENGLGCVADEDKAEKYYTLAANQGYRDSQKNLCLFYEDRGELEKALKFGRMANAQGSNLFLDHIIDELTDQDISDPETTE